MLSDLEQSLIDLTTKLIGICQSNVVRIINQLKKAILSNSIRKCFKLKHVFNQLKTIFSIRLYLFLFSVSILVAMMMGISRMSKVRRKCCEKYGLCRCGGVEMNCPGLLENTLLS